MTIPGNRNHVGTQLCAITEQKSVATLHTVPSNSRFQKRVTILQHPASSVALGVRWQEKGAKGTQHRRCFSLDENTIYKFHHQRSTSQATSNGLLSSLEELGQDRFNQIAKPVKPPYSPPERVQTPEGVPSWRGEVTVQPHGPHTPTSATGLFFHQLRARGSRLFRSVVRSSPGPVQPPVRTWRPPASGHVTQRYGGLEAHPFSSAPVADTGRRLFESLENDREQDQQEHTRLSRSYTAPHAHPRIVQARSPKRENARFERNNIIGYCRALSPSERALQSVSGNAVPVSPHRAQSQVEASTAPRSVSLPINQVSSRPWAGTGGSRLQSGANGTTRTIDLIEQFPTPPIAVPGKRNMSSGHLSLAMTLFPKSNADNQSFNVTRNGKANASGRKLQKRLPSAAISSATNEPSTPDQLPGIHTTNIQSNQRTIEEVDAEEALEDAVEDAPAGGEPGLPPIRGENSTRYRYSGTPVYDVDAASLRSLDRQVEQATVGYNDTNDTIPSPVVSAQTGNSRYFSAASTVLAARNTHQAYPREREEETRAVANGALRFAVRSRILNDEAPNTSRLPAENHENTFPITPVTITKASKTHCTHRIAKLRRDQARRHGNLTLDGTSPARPDETATSNDLPPLPSHPTLHSVRPQPSSTESFGRRHHISRRIVNQFTWRTRMKRTKCWRCELESRQTAIHDHTTGFRVGWAERKRRFKEKLRWTCFGRYKAYEDDSDDQSVVEERARLGRMGGTLN